MSATGKANALRIERVHKSFDGNHVLRGIDLTVAEHEVVCLIGASGSGKSTLLRCVNLLEPIDEGRIAVHGIEISARGVDVNSVRRSIGIVFQAFNLFPHMSVLRNITLAPMEALKMTKAGDDLVLGAAALTRTMRPRWTPPARRSSGKPSPSTSRCRRSHRFSTA